MSAIIDKFSKKELEKLVKESHSLHELIMKLGYSTKGGSNWTTVKNRLDEYEIDYKHFHYFNSITRTPENIFIENSTASQKVLRD